MDTTEHKRTDKSEDQQQATFAGGCFWCMQPPFDKIIGVMKTVVGYAGGEEKNPTYEQVSNHMTSHVEAIQVTYNPSKVSYSDLLEVFWRNVDPFDDKGQFCDKGPQYLAKIFTHSPEQHAAAIDAKTKLELKLGKKIVTEILPFTTFYFAEAYHQNYYKENPIRYKFYRYGCGRDKQLEALWKD